MICLTFDTDHMDEMRMAEFLDSLMFPGTGTFFCTQRYDCLKTNHHELAPHPYLPEGSKWQEELENMRELFPNAVGWRSHSCVFSHLIAEWLGHNGYKYASTNDQYGESGIRPIQQPWGIWHMPIYFMDNLDFSRNRFWDDDSFESFSTAAIQRSINEAGLYIFDFHPIHLMLNTPNYEFYAEKRDRFKSGEPISQLQYKGRGTLTYFNELTATLNKANRQSVSLETALASYISGSENS